VYATPDDLLSKAGIQRTLRAQQTNQPHVHVFEAGVPQELMLRILVSADAFITPLDEPTKWELCLAAASMRVPVVMPPWQQNNVSIHMEDTNAQGGGGQATESGISMGQAGGDAHKAVMHAQLAQVVQPKLRSVFKGFGRSTLEAEQDGSASRSDNEEMQQQQQQQQQRRHLQRFSKLKRKQGFQELPRDNVALQEAVEMRALAAGGAAEAGAAWMLQLG
jgi:hypothetical protein